MKKILLFLLVVSIGMSTVFAVENKLSAKEFAEQMPDLKDVSCIFKQERKVSDMVFTSGGNFRFIENKGVVFETIYPIKITSSYSSNQNKQINDIILAVSNKNFSYLEKNFDLDFSKQDEKWQFMLHPKNDNIKNHLNSVTINGTLNIDKIVIDTVSNGITEISFKCGSE